MSDKLSDNRGFSMRITARLDDETEGYIEKIKQLKGLQTVTDVLKFALKGTVQALEAEARPGDKMKAFLASSYVGSIEGSKDDLSTNYKKYVAEYLDEKYPQHSGKQ